MSKNKVTVEQIDELMGKAQFEVFHRVFGKKCVVVAQLPNGFTVVGTSGVVDPANYVEGIGEQLARDQIKNKLWELEGYNLQTRLYEEGTLDARDSK